MQKGEHLACLAVAAGDSPVSGGISTVTLKSWKQLTKSDFENELELPEQTKVYSHCDFPINMRGLGRPSTCTYIYTHTHSQTHKNVCTYRNIFIVLYLHSLAGLLWVVSFMYIHVLEVSEDIRKIEN